MGETALHIGGAQPVTDVLADLLATLSQEFLQAAQLPVTATPDAVEARSGAQSEAVDVLKRLLAAQREAARAAGPTSTTAADAEGLQDAAAQRQTILDTLMNRLEAAATGLSDSIDRNTPAEVPERCGSPPSIAGVERTLALAHRLSYTSFAPPGFEPGVTPLGVFRPPAPQDGQMRAAQLHQFAAEYEQAELRRQGQLPLAVAEQPATPAVPEVMPALLASIPRMPPGWRPGDPLPGQMPPMPPGWKPGDPLPDAPPAGAPAAPATAAAAATSEHAEVNAPPQQLQPQAAPAAPAKPQRPVLDASFLMLNPDLEEAVEEDYSSEYSESD